MAWVKNGSFWVEREANATAFLAVSPDLSPGLQPVVAHEHAFCRLELVEAVAVTTGARLLVDRSRRGLAEIARGALAIYEKLVSDVAQSRRPALACRKGCSFCCHLTVRLSRAEACLLVEYLQATRSHEALSELRLSARQRFTQRASPGTQSARTPCPLLVAGVCGVYGVRPLQCRGAHSKDASQCERGEQFDAWPEALLLANSIMKGLDVGLQLAGLSSTLLEIDQALMELVQDEKEPSRYAHG